MKSAITKHYLRRLNQLVWGAIVPLFFGLGIASALTNDLSTTDLNVRLQTVHSRLDQVSLTINTLNTNLVQITNAATLELNSLKTEAQTLADQQAALRKTLADLEAQIDTLQKARSVKASKTNAPLNDLQKQIRDAQRELERLAQEEARIQAQAGNQGKTTTLGRTKILGKEMSPLNVAFIKNQVLPVRSPYYREVFDFGGSASIRILPQLGAGESIGQATKLGGCLDLILKDSSPKANYFHFWVSPDSIAAFHAARQFALANQYIYTWSTYNGGSFFPGGDAKVRGAGGAE